MVKAAGLEPTTPRLKTGCTNHCATLTYISALKSFFNKWRSQSSHLNTPKDNKNFASEMSLSYIAIRKITKLRKEEMYATGLEPATRRFKAECANHCATRTILSFKQSLKAIASQMHGKKFFYVCF